MTAVGAKVTRVHCPACGEEVPVDIRPAPETLDDAIGTALAVARAQCPDHEVITG